MTTRAELNTKTTRLDTPYRLPRNALGSTNPVDIKPATRRAASARKVLSYPRLVVSVYFGAAYIEVTCPICRSDSNEASHNSGWGGIAEISSKILLTPATQTSR